MLVFLEPALDPWSISGIHEQGLKRQNRHGKKNNNGYFKLNPGCLIGILK